MKEYPDVIFIYSADKSGDKPEKFLETEEGTLSYNLISYSYVYQSFYEE